MRESINKNFKLCTNLISAREKVKRRQGKDRYNSEMKILKLPGVLVQKREKKIKNGYNNETRERLTTNNDEIKERR